MEAAWAKAELEAEKHKAKMAAKEEARANREMLLQPAAKKPKHERKVHSTAEQRQRRMRAPLPGEDADNEPVQQLRVFKDDGSDVTYARAVVEIVSFLQDYDQEATQEEVRRALGIDLLQQDGVLLDELEHHPRIERIADPASDRLRYKPPYGVRNRGMLVHVLTNAQPHAKDLEPDALRPVLRSELNPDETYAGVDVSKVTIDVLVDARRAASASAHRGGGMSRSELNPDETYVGVDVDVDELLAEGRVARVEPSDKRHTDFLLFAMPPGRPAIEEVRALWRQERVPQGTQLQEELLKRNLRSKDELAKRKERKAAELKAAKERADAEKGKKDRTGSIRTWKNTHLGTSDELSEMFRR